MGQNHTSLSIDGWRQSFKQNHNHTWVTFLKINFHNVGLLKPVEKRIRVPPLINFDWSLVLHFYWSTVFMSDTAQQAKPASRIGFSPICVIIICVIAWLGVGAIVITLVYPSDLIF
jgi:hypothetical protein